MVHMKMDDVLAFVQVKIDLDQIFLVHSNVLDFDEYDKLEEIILYLRGLCMFLYFKNKKKMYVN